MKKIALIIFSIFLSCSIFAAEKVSKELAMEYLKTARIENVINTSRMQYEVQLFGKAKPEEKEIFHKIMVDVMGWEATKDQLAGLVMQVYTKEEIEASIAYMKSPLGASAIAKNEEFSKQFANILSENLKKVISQCCTEKNKK